MVSLCRAGNKLYHSIKLAQGHLWAQTPTPLSFVVDEGCVSFLKIRWGHDHLAIYCLRVGGSIARPCPSLCPILLKLVKPFIIITGAEMLLIIFADEIKGT